MKLVVAQRGEEIVQRGTANGKLFILLSGRGAISLRFDSTLTRFDSILPSFPPTITLQITRICVFYSQADDAEERRASQLPRRGAQVGARHSPADPRAESPEPRQRSRRWKLRPVRTDHR